MLKETTEWNKKEQSGVFISVVNIYNQFLTSRTLGFFLGGVGKDERSDYVHINLIAIYFKLFIFNISTKFQTGETMDRKLNSNIEENLKLH